MTKQTPVSEMRGTPVSGVEVHDGDILCICGNRPDLDGFPTVVLNEGTYTEVEPTTDSGWVDLYACSACGLVIRPRYTLTGYFVDHCPAYAVKPDSPVKWDGE